VFVGFTATAEGDFAATPISAQLPGVIVHANLLNALLNDIFIQRPPRWLEITIILAFGSAVTILTATRGPITTLMLTLIIMLAYALVNCYVFFAMLRWWIVLVAPLAACLVPWAIVTAYRQLTAERQKRFVQAQLGEFTSPALAKRIAEDPTAALALQL